MTDLTHVSESLSSEPVEKDKSWASFMESGGDGDIAITMHNIAIAEPLQVVRFASSHVMACIEKNLPMISIKSSPASESLQTK